MSQELQQMLFPTQPAWATLVRAAAVYVFVLFLFRLLGRNEISRHTSFDVAVLFLVGAALRKTMVADDNSLTTSFLALFTLFGLDRVTATLAWKSPAFARIVEGRPLQLVRDGALQWEALRRARLTEHELREHLRKKGTEDLAKVRHAYVERDGQITFVMR